VRRTLLRRAICFAALLVLALPASAQPGDICPPPGEGFQQLAGGDIDVAYRWEPRDLKVGRFFSAEVIACRPRASVTRIALEATMPAHGHGMNYLPKATEIAPGRFRFTGLMLHMPGRWQLTIDLYDGNKLVRRLTRDLDLKP
jgi:hypothetical protein